MIFNSSEFLTLYIFSYNVYYVSLYAKDNQSVAACSKISPKHPNLRCDLFIGRNIDRNIR